MYRKNVGCIFEDQGRVLVGKRSDVGTWQFPQGGIDDKENEEEALFREMEEEIGTNKFQIIAKHPSLLKYNFPDGFKRGNFFGQEQRWFLAKFEEDLSLKKHDAEFDEFEWVSPKEALNRIVYFKRQIYETILIDFKLL